VLDLAVIGVRRLVCYGGVCCFLVDRSPARDMTTRKLVGSVRCV